MYIPTSVNPSDGPSRLQDFPPPLDPLPDWWIKALRGDFRDLDKWLCSLEADPWAISGIPDLEAVRKSGPRELIAQKAAKKKANNSKLKGLLRQPTKQARALDRDDRRSALEPEATLLGRHLRGSLLVPEGVELSSIIDKPGYIDLFSGSRGVALELARLSGRWVITYDIKDSVEQDL